MADLFASGRVVDCILGMMLIELAALLVLRLRSRRGLPAAQLLAALGAGAALLLALRAALLGAPWERIAPWLLAALVAHLVDIGCRWNCARESEVT